MPTFDFSCEVKEANWLVEPIIPLEHFCINLAQAGVGKSLLVENLAVCLVFGVPFCGFKAVEGDVLLGSSLEMVGRCAQRLGKDVTAQAKEIIGMYKGEPFGYNLMRCVTHPFEKK